MMIGHDPTSKVKEKGIGKNGRKKGYQLVSAYIERYN